MKNRNEAQVFRIMSYDIWTELERINKDKSRRPSKIKPDLLKQKYPHTTTSGVGVIGRLRKKKKNKK